MPTDVGTEFKVKISKKTSTNLGKDSKESSTFPLTSVDANIISSEVHNEKITVDNGINNFKEWNYYDYYNNFINNYNYNNTVINMYNVNDLANGDANISNPQSSNSDRYFNNNMNFNNSNLSGDNNNSNNGDNNNNIFKYQLDPNMISQLNYDQNIANIQELQKMYPTYYQLPQYAVINANSGTDHQQNNVSDRSSIDGNHDDAKVQMELYNRYLASNLFNVNLDSFYGFGNNNNNGNIGLLIEEINKSSQNLENNEQNISNEEIGASNNMNNLNVSGSRPSDSVCSSSITSSSTGIKDPNGIAINDNGTLPDYDGGSVLNVNPFGLMLMNNNYPFLQQANNYYGLNSTDSSAVAGERAIIDGNLWYNNMINPNDVNSSSVCTNISAGNSIDPSNILQNTSVSQSVSPSVTYNNDIKLQDSGNIKYGLDLYAHGPQLCQNNNLYPVDSNLAQDNLGKYNNNSYEDSKNIIFVNNNPISFPKSRNFFDKLNQVNENSGQLEREYSHKYNNINNVNDQQLNNFGSGSIDNGFTDMSQNDPNNDPNNKQVIYHKGKQRNFSKNDWINIFKEIDSKNSSILSISKKIGIRRQIISSKYKKWKHYGDSYIDCNLWSNKIFTKEEELELIHLLWNLPKKYIKGTLFSDLTISDISLKFYNEIRKKRKIKPFKASLGWIMDFRKRYDIDLKDDKFFYHQWEILK